jgi:hypothetical protein
MQKYPKFLCKTWILGKYVLTFLLSRLAYFELQILTMIIVFAGFVWKANSAKWEPPHGKFRHFFYPWSEYVKVGAVLRYCAYEVMALHGVLHSEIQVFSFHFSLILSMRVHPVCNFNVAC